MFRPARDREPLPSKRLIAILLIAIGLRAGLSLWLPTDQAFLAALPDQLEYLEAGRSLLAGEGLTIVDERYQPPQTLRAYRMPGYPLLVAATGGNVMAIRLFQAILDTATVLGVFFLANRWLSNGPSLVAAGLVALHPYIISFSALVLTETVFTFLLVTGVLCMARPGTTGRLWWLGMLLLALSVYFRPSGAALAVLLALASTFLPGRHPFAVHSRWPLPAGLTGILILGVILSPWVIRNWQVLGEPVFLTTNDGITLYDGWNPDNTAGGSDQRFVPRMPQLTLMNEIERSAYFKERAVEAIRERPGRAAVLALKKLGRTWSPVSLSRVDQPVDLVAGIGLVVPMMLLAGLGLVLGPLPRSAKLMLALPAVYLSVVHMLSVGSMRYRLPADALLAILAAAGVWVVLAYVRREDAEAGEDAVPADGERQEQGLGNGI